MHKNKVNGFEIPVADVKKAKKFYETIFDWEIELWGDDGAMALTAGADENKNPTEIGGINGGFYKRGSKKQQPSIVIETDNIDETLRAVKKAGGTIETPKHALGEWGYMADICDPEGNQMALWQQNKK